MVTVKENLGLFERTYLRTLNTLLDYGGLTTSLLSGISLVTQDSHLSGPGIIASMASPVVDNLFISSEPIKRFSDHKREEADHCLDNYTNGQIIRNIIALLIPQQTANTYNDPTPTNILTTAGLVGLTILSQVFSRSSKKRLTDLVAER